MEFIADQIGACRAFCAGYGLEVVAEFEDAAISGALTANRPGLADLRRAAEAERFDVVVTEALDRLSRSPPCSRICASRASPSARSPKARVTR